MNGPVLNWKELSFTFLYHINHFLQKKCLIYELYRQNTLRPTFWTTLLPTLMAICGPMFVYYLTNVYFTQIGGIFLKLFVLSVAKNRKIEKRWKFGSEGHWSAVPGTYPIQTIGPNRLRRCLWRPPGSQKMWNDKNGPEKSIYVENRLLANFGSPAHLAWTPQKNWKCKKWALHMQNFRTVPKKWSKFAFGVDFGRFTFCGPKIWGKWTISFFLS